MKRSISAPNTSGLESCASMADGFDHGVDVHHEILSVILALFGSKHTCYRRFKYGPGSRRISRAAKISRCDCRLWAATEGSRVGFDLLDCRFV